MILPENQCSHWNLYRWVFSFFELVLRHLVCVRLIWGSEPAYVYWPENPEPLLNLPNFRSLFQWGQPTHFDIWCELVLGCRSSCTHKNIRFLLYSVLSGPDTWANENSRQINPRHFLVSVSFGTKYKSLNIKIIFWFFLNLKLSVQPWIYLLRIEF